MAKFLVSLPEDLVERLDQRARELGTSRSGLLRDLAQRELAAANRRRAASIGVLLGEPGHYGGGGAAAVRQLRESR